MSLCYEEIQSGIVVLFSLRKKFIRVVKIAKHSFALHKMKTIFASKYQIQCTWPCCFPSFSSTKRILNSDAIAVTIFSEMAGKFIYYFIKTVCKLSARLRGPKDASRRRQITAKNTTVSGFWLDLLYAEELGVCSSFVGTGKNANNAYYHSLCFPSCPLLFCSLRSYLFLCVCLWLEIAAFLYFTVRTCVLNERENFV